MEDVLKVDLLVVIKSLITNVFGIKIKLFVVIGMVLFVKIKLV